MFDVVREVSNDYCQDIVSKVVLFDQFYNTKLNKLSRAYRIHYSSPDPNMNNPAELFLLVNQLHLKIAQNLHSRLGVEIR
jgi:phenylalanyl-tRNA synthetase beta subunit